MPSPRIVARVEYRGQLQPGSLEQGLRRLLARHDILRAIFRQSGQSPAPIRDASSEASFGISVHDMRSLSEDERRAEIEKRMQLARVVPLDPSEGKAFHITRLDEDDDHCHFVVSAHALILDAESLERAAGT
jgi:hypothetical protein